MELHEIKIPDFPIIIVELHKIIGRIAMKLNDAIVKRIEEICNKYIEDWAENDKQIDISELKDLSCTELIFLYYNLEWTTIRRGVFNGKEKGKCADRRQKLCTYHL